MGVLAMASELTGALAHLVRLKGFQYFFYLIKFATFAR